MSFQVLLTKCLSGAEIGVVIEAVQQRMRAELEKLDQKTDAAFEEWNAMELVIQQVKTKLPLPGLEADCAKKKRLAMEEKCTGDLTEALNMVGAVEPPEYMVKTQVAELQRSWTQCKQHVLPIASDCLRAKLATVIPVMLKLLVHELARPLEDNEEDMLGLLPKLCSDIRDMVKVGQGKLHPTHRKTDLSTAFWWVAS